jgi:aspartate-semialdehyde dehydrogenase
VPLVVPEVNPDAVMGFDKLNIIANPNCSTAQLVVALKPLHDRAKITRVVVATYQSVSGKGKEAMEELWTQTRGIFVNDEIRKEQFTKQIAFNVIPHIDVFMEDGYTKEEWKMNVETKKILDPKIKLTATCVRVPVFVGHSEAVNVEFENPICGRRGPRDPARSAGRSWWSISARMAAISRPSSAVGDYATYRQPHPRGQRPSKTASPSGASATICARAQLSTRCRSLS